MARSYSTINSKLWAGRTGIKLRENIHARVVQVYLLSCQSANAIGLYHVGLPTVAHETGLTVDEVRAAIAFLRDECDGFCNYDEAVELAWVPRMALFQIGESIKPKDKVRPSLVRSALEWKGHPFFDRFVETYAERYGLAELQGIASKTPKQEAPSKPLPENAEGASAQQDDAGSGRVGSGLSSHTHTAGAGGVGPGIAPNVTNHTPVTVSATGMHPLPDGFTPDSGNVATAQLHDLNLAAELDSFTAHARDQGRNSADWQSAFRRWLNESAKRKQNERHTAHRTGSRTPQRTPEQDRKAAERSHAITVIDCDLCGGMHRRCDTGNGTDCKPKDDAA